MLATTATEITKEISCEEERFLWLHPGHYCKQKSVLNYHEVVRTSPPFSQNKKEVHEQHISAIILK